MSDEFPSIWVEINYDPYKPMLVAGFYRQWSHETLPKEEAEQNGISILTNQIESGIYRQSPVKSPDIKTLLIVSYSP